VRIAPDGKSAIYTEQWHPRSEGSTEGASYTNLWSVSTDGRGRTPLTEGEWRDWSPRWAAEAGAVAYLSNRTGRTQIRIRKFPGAGDAQVGDLAQTPRVIALSPAGDAVAFTAIVAQKPDAAWAPPELIPFLRAAVAGHLQLFVLPVAGGAARQITSGDLNWLGKPAWMPDGRTILCEAAGDPDPAHPLDGGKIFSVRVMDGAMKQLTQHEGRDEQPTPSPDGSRIAWLSTDARRQSYTVRQLYVMNADGSRVKQLSGGFDRDVSQPQWSSDSRTVYFLAEDAGAAHVYAARNDGTIRAVTKGAERLRDFSLADNGRAVAIRSSARETGDVITFAADLPGGSATLYSPNEHLLAEREIGGAEELRYESAGHSIQAWLVRPPGFDAAKKYPLLLDLQDAPRAMYGPEFHLRAQILAAAGFVVLLANPRGSAGYGEEFGNLLPTRNPGDDADDLLRGVDAAMAKGYIDTKKLAISGGLTAAWILAHSDRFAAAVLRNPVAERVSEFALAPDGLRRALSEMGALPWDDPAQYWQHSPIYFAGGFKTPALIVAAQGDVQAREIYVALRARKVDSALLELPGGRDVDALRAELEWLRALLLGG
jgi:dipeptidyl aminopeptidase/acylaminoacyl peptidase